MLQKIKEESEMPKKYFTSEREKYLKDVVELNRVFPLVEIEQISLQDTFMQYQPKNPFQFEIKRAIIMAKQMRIKNFRVPIYDPSYTDDGKNIIYAPNREPAILKSVEDFNKMVEMCKNFIPEMNTRIGTELERRVFLGYIIKTLVEKEGIEIGMAWYLVCDESSKLAPYGLSEKEKTGTFKVGKWYDLGNTKKLTLPVNNLIPFSGTIDETLVSFGGCYSDMSAKKPLASTKSIESVSLEFTNKNNTVWMVMDEKMSTSSVFLNKEGVYPNFEDLTISTTGKNFDEIFPIVNVEQMTLKDKFLKLMPNDYVFDKEEFKDPEEYAYSVKNHILCAIKGGMRSFRTPFCAPSLSYNGKNIVYELGKAPIWNRISGDIYDFDRICKNFMPQKNSRAMNVMEMHVFIGTIFKYLIEEEGYSVKYAWEILYSEHQERGIKNGKTGETHIGKWYDLYIPTIVLRGKAKGNFAYEVGRFNKNIADMYGTSTTIKSYSTYRLIMDV